MDELAKVLGKTGESNSETLSLCVTPTIRIKFERLTSILEQKRLKRPGLARLKSALDREIDEMLKLAESEQAS